jgi:hypothetical protein
MVGAAQIVTGDKSRPKALAISANNLAADEALPPRSKKLSFPRISVRSSTRRQMGARTSAAGLPVMIARMPGRDPGPCCKANRIAASDRQHESQELPSSTFQLRRSLQLVRSESR